VDAPAKQAGACSGRARERARIRTDTVVDHESRADRHLGYVTSPAPNDAARSRVSTQTIDVMVATERDHRRSRDKESLGGSPTNVPTGTADNSAATRQLAGLRLEAQERHGHLRHEMW
jgi:hypothetical protein